MLSWTTLTSTKFFLLTNDVSLNICFSLLSVFQKLNGGWDFEMGILPHTQLNTVVNLQCLTLLNYLFRVVQLTLGADPFVNCNLRLISHMFAQLIVIISKYFYSLFLIFFNKESDFLR